jgi:hypothetical protein
MSLAVGILLAVTVAAAPESADEQDIVVVAKRLDGVTASITRNAQGKFQCGLSRSTGVINLDDALCKTATKCVRKGASTVEAVNACVTKRKPALLEDVRALLKARKS